MSDDRLFASNNAIGRKWYYINLVILTALASFTNFLFLDYIIPNVTTEVHEIMAKGVMWFAYIIYLVTLFSLIDRRLYDICGTRDNKGYRNTSAVLGLAVFMQILSLYCAWKKPSVSIPYEFIDFAAMILDMVFFAVVFIIGLFKGKISNLSYEEYKKKIKYE